MILVESVMPWYMEPCRKLELDIGGGLGSCIGRFGHVRVGTKFGVLVTFLGTGEAREEIGSTDSYTEFSDLSDFSIVCVTNSEP